MTRLETRIRDSLQARAQDVEPTPALWQRISDLVDRRVRARRVLYALAGAAVVAVLAVAVVPNVMELFVADPAPPEILDAPATSTETSAPAGAVVPEHTVTTDGSALHLVSSATGETVRELYAPAPEGATIEGLAVRPGSTRDDLTIAYLRLVDGSYDIQHVRLVDGEVAAEGIVDQGPLNFNVPEGEVEPPVPVWSADGSELAYTYTGRTEGEPGGVVLLKAWTDAGPTEASPTVLRTDELVPGALKLQDWVGDREDGFLLATTGQRGLIESAAAPGRGLVLRDLRPSDAAADQLEAEVVELAGDRGAVIDVASPHSADSIRDGLGPEYRLVAGGSDGQDAESSGLRVEWLSDDHDDRDTIPVPQSLAQTADPFGVWMTALRDGVLVGNGQEAFVLTRDGGAEPTALPEGTIHADFLPTAGDAARMPGATAAPTHETTEAVPDDAGTAAPSEAVVVGPRRVVVAGLRTLTLVDRQTGDTQELVSLDPIGESAIERVAVRPGSTPDEMTVVFMALSEGMYDIRYVSVRDGQPGDLQYLPQELQPATAGNPGEISIPAPVWSPEGDALAYAETVGEGDTQQLRVVGWAEDGPSQDPNVRSASFGLPSLPATVQLQDWVWTEGPDTGALLATETELLEAAEVRIPIERQGDAAFATGPSEDVRVYGTEVPVLDVDGAPEGSPTGARMRRLGDGRVQIALAPFGRDGTRVDLPAAFVDAVDAGGRPWMVGDGEHLLVGVLDGPTLSVSRAGDLTPVDLPDGLTPRYVAPLR